MNEIFPPLHVVSSVNAMPGSILRLPRQNGRFLALVTNHRTNEAGRSLVLLNAELRGRPPIIFAENWHNELQCLSYKSDLHFEISADENDFESGHKWWEASGVIVCLEDQFYLRVAPMEPFNEPYRLVNVRTGELLSTAIPNDVWTFGVWQLWFRDSARERDTLIYEFDIHKRS